MIALADYFAANPNPITIEGMGGTSSSREIDRHLHKLLDTVHQNDEAVADLKRQFQALLSGACADRPPFKYRARRRSLAAI